MSTRCQRVRALHQIHEVLRAQGLRRVYRRAPEGVLQCGNWVECGRRWFLYSNNTYRSEKQ